MSSIGPVCKVSARWTRLEKKEMPSMDPESGYAWAEIIPRLISK